MGIRQETASSTQPLSLTPFGEACLRTDLTAIHEILEKIGYKDDEGIANEVCQLLFVIDGLFLLLKNVTILTPESIK
jgi:hypothetical protein